MLGTQAQTLSDLNHVLGNFIPMNICMSTGRGKETCSQIKDPPTKFIMKILFTCARYNDLLDSLTHCQHFTEDRYPEDSTGPLHTAMLGSVQHSSRRQKDGTSSSVAGHTTMS